MRRLARLLPLLLLALPEPSPAQEIVKQVGQLMIAVDPSFGYQGGLLVVHLRSRRGLGTASAILEGKRYSFYGSRGGPRAFVPVPVTATPGVATLGIEILTRRGRQRIPVEVPVSRRDYPPRTVVIPEDRRGLLAAPGTVRDGRRLLAALRAETPVAAWVGPFRPPVATAPIASFGGSTTHVGGSPVERLTDSIFGEYHRGLDYPVPAGTVVQAPAGGTVVLAGLLTLTGRTLVLDHGQGVVSVLFHLLRLDVKEGDRVEGRAPVALSGDTGLAVGPHVHWGAYVHGVAVDPRFLESLEE